MTARATDSKASFSKVSAVALTFIGVLAIVAVAAFTGYFGTLAVGHAVVFGDTLPLLGVMSALAVVFFVWNTISSVPEKR